MGMQVTSRILITGTFFVWVLIGTHVMAQNTAPSKNGGTNQQAQSSKAAHYNSVAEHNPACQRIVSECKKLGFIPGQWKKDNGLWKDCFDPIVKGAGSPTRDGKPISVPVSPSDVQACRAAEGHGK
jgi:hypothetical protein